MNAVKKLVKSFLYAFRGIFTCVKTCRNFRIHTVAVFYVLLFSTFYNFDRIEYAVLFLTFGAVLCAEAFNSSLEFTCNAVNSEYCDKIKKAKDTAAAAVLISAIFAIGVAASLFIEPQVIKSIFTYFSNSAFETALFLISILASVFFIFYEDIFKNGKK